MGGGGVKFWSGTGVVDHKEVCVCVVGTGIGAEGERGGHRYHEMSINPGSTQSHHPFKEKDEEEEEKLDYLHGLLNSLPPPHPATTQLLPQPHSAFQ
jgi:hypothetical protein